VRQNKLRAVSREIGLLTRIVSLKLSQNKIAVLPDDLGRLCAMQMCFLEENELRALPATMQTCTALKVLDVSKNRITMLPTGLWRCGRITKINTYDNPLRLPPEVVSLGAAPILATLRALNTAETDGVLRLEGLQLRAVPECVLAFTNVCHAPPPPLSYSSLPITLLYCLLSSSPTPLLSPTPPPTTRGALPRRDTHSPHTPRRYSPPPPPARTAPHGPRPTRHPLRTRRGRRVTPPRPIPGPPQVTELSLANNRLRDVAAVHALASLRTLSLAHNKIARLPLSLATLTGPSRRALPPARRGPRTLPGIGTSHACNIAHVACPQHGPAACVQH